MRISRKQLPPSMLSAMNYTWQVMRDPALLLWALYILLFPIYIIKSGLPQPGDWLILLLAPTVLGRGKVRIFRAAVDPTKALLLFTLFVVVSNLAWSFALGTFDTNLKRGFILSPLFYIYNTLFFLVALVLYTRYRDRFLWLTLWMTLVSVVLQSIIAVKVGHGFLRSQGMFNNPNQLGHFALLSASILCFGRRRLGFGSLPLAIGMVACTWLAILSASKAALGGVVVLVAVGILANPRVVFLSMVTFLTLLVFFDPLEENIDRAEYRIEHDKHAGFFLERGYDRIDNNPEYWVLGSGEGDYERFLDSTFIGEHELHSSAGTIFFSYGIPGSLLFLWFAFRLLKRSRMTNLLLLTPAAAYSLTHQTLRVTLVWVLFAIFLALKDVPTQGLPKQAPAPPPPGPAIRVAP